MTRWLLLALALTLVTLSLSCGDDDSATPLPTPTASVYKPPTDTPGPTPSGGKPSPNDSFTPGITPSPIPLVTARPDLRTCGIDDLAAAFVHSGAAAGSVGYSFGFSNTSGTACALPGPPSRTLLDSGHAELPIQAPAGIPCTTSIEACVVSGRIELSPAAPTPVDLQTPGQAGLLLLIADLHNYDPPCGSPSIFARYLSVSFPGITDIVIQFPSDVELQTCYSQISTYLFGPDVD